MTAAVVLEVLDVLEVADVLGVDADVGDVTDGGASGVPGGQSEPASAGGVQGMMSRKTGEHWAPRLASYRL